MLCMRVKLRVKVVFCILEVSELLVMRWVCWIWFRCSCVSMKVIISSIVLVLVIV